MAQMGSRRTRLVEARHRTLPRPALSDRETLARAVADALLDGQWQPAPMAARAAEVLGYRPRWLQRVLEKVRAEFPQAPRGARDELARALERAGLRNRRENGGSISPRRFNLKPAKMGRRRWPVPKLATARDLAIFLGVEIAVLERLADRKGFARFAAAEAMRNYRYRWFPKSGGGSRLLEVPKLQLRTLQRRILHGILDLIPPHAMAHGFSPGRSLLGFVKPHSGRALLLRLDLESFFSSVASARVFGIFRSAGYPEGVARILAAICTHRTPAHVLEKAPGEMARTPDERRRVLQRLAAPHLPQGAPTSPALANLVAYGMDVRLAAAAANASALYTRYADDLAFSFDAAGARRGSRFYPLAAGIALDEGFSVQFRKTRFVRRGDAQRLGGLVVNEHPNVPRREFDRLKAMLHRAVKLGPEEVSGLRPRNLQAQLLGRIGWVEQVNLARGKKLRALYERVDWANAASQSQNPAQKED